MRRQQHLFACKRLGHGARLFDYFSNQFEIRDAQQRQQQEEQEEQMRLDIRCQRQLLIGINKFVALIINLITLLILDAYLLLPPSFPFQFLFQPLL